MRFYDVTLSAPEVKAVHAEVAELVPAVHITLDESVENIGSGGSRYDATIYGTNIV